MVFLKNPQERRTLSRRRNTMSNLCKGKDLNVKWLNLNLLLGWSLRGVFESRDSEGGNSENRDSEGRDCEAANLLQAPKPRQFKIGEK